MQLLVDNSLLTLFVVIGVGAAVGTVTIRGISLGPAAALFVGLAASAIDEDLADLPLIVSQIGLALFVYTVGLASGPSFVAEARRGGAKVLAAVALLLVGVLGAVEAVSTALDFDTGARAGLFAGVLTNTPALSAALEALAPRIATGEVTDPVVGYSLAYPAGVMAMLFAAHWSLRRGTVPRTAQAVTPPTRPATNATVKVTRSDLAPLGELRGFGGGSLVFSRYEHDGVVAIATTDVRLVPGDRCVVIGDPVDVERFIEWAGERSERHLARDRSTFDFRRISVSNRALAGTRLGDLDLEGRFGAMVTRVRRGDTDRIADPDTVLRLGDRLRVVGPVGRLADVAALLGDSERGLGEVDPTGFAVGMSLGLLLGVVAVPLPGGGSIELGVAGGPLVVGLVLGTISRTGPVTWQIPHAANLTLRQLGILIFLAAVGIRSGSAFADAIGTPLGARLAVAGVGLAALVAVASLIVLRLLRSDPVVGAGRIAGIETQPAVHAYAASVTNGDERVDAGYALVLPLAMIAKLVLVQLIL